MQGIHAVPEPASKHGHGHGRACACVRVAAQRGLTLGPACIAFAMLVALPIVVHGQERGGENMEHDEGAYGTDGQAQPGSGHYQVSPTDMLRMYVEQYGWYILGMAVLWYNVQQSVMQCVDILAARLRSKRSDSEVEALRQKQRRIRDKQLQAWAQASAENEKARKKKKGDRLEKSKSYVDSGYNPLTGTSGGGTGSSTYRRQPGTGKYGRNRRSGGG